MSEEFIELESGPMTIEEILKGYGIESGGPSPWGHSFWDRALRCPYDGYLTKVFGFPPARSKALIIGILVHICIAIWISNRVKLGNEKAQEMALTVLKNVEQWCFDVLAKERSYWAQNLFGYTQEASFLVQAYFRHWHLPPGGMVDVENWTVNDLLHYEHPRPFLVEEIVETSSPFPYTVRYDSVYIVKDVDGAPCAVGKDIKTMTGETNLDWVRSYYQDPQLLGYLHTWNSTAKKRNVPEMRYAIIDAIQKPTTVHGLPILSRHLFPLKPSRVKLWAVSMEKLTRSWLDYAKAVDLEQTSAEPWRTIPMNFVSCFKRRYQPCERLIDHCLDLHDMSVYPSATAAITVPSPVVQPQPQPQVQEVPKVSAAPKLPVVAAAPQMTATAVKYMTRVQKEAIRQGCLETGQRVSLICETAFNKDLDDLTFDEAQSIIDSFKTHIVILPNEPDHVNAPPLEPVGLDDLPVTPREEFEDLLSELRLLASHDDHKLGNLLWLEKADYAALSAHASTYSAEKEQLEAVIDDEDLLRLELVKVWHNRAMRRERKNLEKPAPAPAPVQASQEEPQPPTEPQKDERRQVVVYDPKNTYQVVKVYPSKRGPIESIQAGQWVHVRGMHGFLTLDTNASGERLVMIEGGSKLGVALGTVVVPCDVEIAGSSKPLDEQVDQASKVVGKIPTINGEKEILYLGCYQRLGKRIKEIIAEAVKSGDSYGVVMVGKPGKEAMKLFGLDPEENVVTIKQGDVGNAIWAAIGRMVQL